MASATRSVKNSEFVSLRSGLQSIFVASDPIILSIFIKIVSAVDLVILVHKVEMVTFEDAMVVLAVDLVIFGDKVEMIMFEGAVVVAVDVNVRVEKMEVEVVFDGGFVVPVDALIFVDMVVTETFDGAEVERVVFANMLDMVEFKVADVVATVGSLDIVTVDTVMRDAAVVVSLPSCTTKLKVSKESNVLNAVISAI